MLAGILNRITGNGADVSAMPLPADELTFVVPVLSLRPLGDSGLELILRLSIQGPPGRIFAAGPQRGFAEARDELAAVRESVLTSGDAAAWRTAKERLRDHDEAVLKLDAKIERFKQAVHDAIREGQDPAAKEAALRTAEGEIASLRGRRAVLEKLLAEAGSELRDRLRGEVLDAARRLAKDAAERLARAKAAIGPAILADLLEYSACWNQQQFAGDEMGGVQEFYKLPSA